VPAGIRVANLVSGKRLEIRNGDQRIVVDRKRQALFVPIQGKVYARFRHDRVYLWFGAKALEMTIPIAAKVGFALAKNGGACRYLGDFVFIEVGGEEIHLLPADAEQLGGVMLRKADRADDWQRLQRNPRRVVQ
jgi:hypothetical protein